MGKRSVYLGVWICGIVLAYQGKSLAEPVGLKVIENTSPAALEAGLVSCNLSVEFDSPSDVLLSIGFSHILTDDPNGFFQDLQFGSDLPSNNSLCALLPLLCSDSYVTIGTSDQNDGLATDPDFCKKSFNCSCAGAPPAKCCADVTVPPSSSCGETSGGWFAIPATPPLGTPDDNMLVLIGQFTVREGFNVSGNLSVFFDTGIKFPGSFDCFGDAGHKPCEDDPTLCGDEDACTSDLCLPADPEADENGCVNLPINCNDDDTCTIDGCDAASGCTNLQIKCKVGETCIDGVCTPVGKCDGPEDCDDSNACTDNECIDAVCAHSPTDCSDGDACTTDGCDTVTGCTHEATDCNDDDACTTDGCNVVSGCVNTPMDCDDDDACTADSCESAAGCLNTKIDCGEGFTCDSEDGSCDCDDDQACDDGSFCSGVETCGDDGKCLGGDDPCAEGQVCDEQNDVCISPGCGSDAECDNGLFCDGVETCNATGMCVPGTNPCPPRQVCNELNDACIGGECEVREDCDDEDGCTSDACVTGVCVNTQVDCDDDSFCTVDSCVDGECVNTLICDDGNPCTDDICNPQIGCSHPFNTSSCNDGNACTTSDACSAGVCVGGPGKNCNDGNPCTTDGCDPATGCTVVVNSDTCDDGLFCNGSDICGGGTCSVHAGDPCVSGTQCNNCCNEQADNCSCGTGTPCGNPAQSPCDIADTCNPQGICLNASAPYGTPCGNPADTDCDNPDSCDGSGTCLPNYEPQGTTCKDGDECTTSDSCDGGTCVGVGAPNCDDGNVCTADSCDREMGCVHSPVKGSCDDGNACTTIDTCARGVCAGGPPPNCNDGNICTDDSCDPLAGCSHVNNHAPADDGLFCNGTDFCSGGTIQHSGDPCATGAACNNQCNEGANHCFSAAGTPCGSGDNTDCDNPDTCNGAGVCQSNNEPNGSPCPDDGHVCTLDACNAGVCVHSNVPTGVPCGSPSHTECDFADSCNGAGDCLANNAPNGTACQDGNACTTNDACTAGLCAGGPTPNCDDHNVCTTDGCAPATGCTHVNNSGPCNDGNACTHADVCFGGGCAGQPINCDDKIACTVDSCSNGQCAHAPNNAACNDSVACTHDVCDPATGCHFTPDHTICEDGVACTDDKCDLVQGCKFPPNNAACNDDDICTSDVCHPQTGCVNTPGGELETVALDTAAQGNICQNVYRPVVGDGSAASFELSARTSIDPNSPTVPNAAGSVGSVIVTEDGTGVKKADCGGGSKGISGSGGDQDEELIFAFDSPLPADSISIGLNQIRFNEDQPVIFLTGVGGVAYTILEPEIMAAFSSTGPERGTVDFGAFSTLPTGISLTSFKVRETQAHIFVDLVSQGCADGGCVDAGDCDDEDPCTNDACVGGQCVNVPLACPEGTTCVDGECVDQPCPNEQSIDLTKDGQGDICQNSYRPVTEDGSAADLVLTARTKIDPNNPTNPNAAGASGSVVISKYGAGVKKSNCGGGSKSVDGKGSGQDEELIFTFDQPVPIESILIGLNKVKLNKIEPVLFLTAGNGTTYTVLKPEILSTFTPTSSKGGVVNLAALSSVPADLSVAKLAVRETAYKLYVDLLLLGCPEGGGCADDANCNDNDPCTTDACVAGQCVNTPLQCSQDKVCLTGTCTCADPDGDGKVKICHIPPGHPENAHTITVSVNALPAHLAHGDTCGPCEDGQPCSEEESVVLTKDEQGDICQNSYRPMAEDGTLAVFALTARTSINPNGPTDPNASGNVGSVIISNYGAGVKKANCGGGSKGISGSGGDQDEELIFTFDQPVAAESIIVGLNKVEFNKAEPVFFITGSGGTVYTILEPQILAAFTSTGSKSGVVRFDAFSALPSNLTITQIKIRETKDHVYVESLTAGCPDE